MIRGLIEFHRIRAFTFNYDLKQRLIVADIDIKDLPHLQSFLLKVLQWLKQEGQFRLALKIARDFESRYQLERESVYTILKNTVAASTR